MRPELSAEQQRAWQQLQPQEASIEPMGEAHVPAVMQIERAAYPWPWSDGNMRDSMRHGHCCQVLCAGEQVLGYFVAMRGVDEVHLLNITVAPQVQGQGWARVMLDVLVTWTQEQQARWLWLEVRKSNLRAQHIYERYGFGRVSVRKAYYPLDGSQREDAIVMNLRVGTA